MLCFDDSLWASLQCQLDIRVTTVGKKGEREGEREGGREGERERGRERGREGERERGMLIMYPL